MCPSSGLAVTESVWHPSMVLVLLYLVRFSLVNQWILELVCVYIVIMDTNSV